MPEPDTDREDLRDVIVHTLGRLAHRGHVADETTAKIITWHWPFPLWPLAIPEPSRVPDNRDGLREVRRRTIEWMDETEAKRDPPPAISRLKVEELSDACAVWKSDADACTGRGGENEESGMQVRHSADYAKAFELPSYARLKSMFRELNGKERAALLALGFYARERVADWPKIYERAVREEPTTDERYQISCACYWMDGLDRWEEKPQRFQPGRWRRLL